MDLEMIYGLVIVYIFGCIFGSIINFIFSNPDIYTTNQYNSSFLSAKILNSTNNKRVSKEGIFFLYVIFIILWAPILAVNILQALLLFLKKMFKGFMNVCWVFGSDKVAKEANIDPEAFDQWSKQLEEFIESIPVRENTK